MARAGTRSVSSAGPLAILPQNGRIATGWPADDTAPRSRREECATRRNGSRPHMRHGDVDSEIEPIELSSQSLERKARQFPERSSETRGRSILMKDATSTA